MSDSFAPDMNAESNTDEDHSDKMNVFTGSTLLRSFDDRGGESRPSFSSFRCPSKPLPSAGGRGFLDPRTLSLSDLDFATRQRLKSMVAPPKDQGAKVAPLPKWPPTFKDWPGIDDDKC